MVGHYTIISSIRRLSSYKSHQLSPLFTTLCNNKSSLLVKQIRSLSYSEPFYGSPRTSSKTYTPFQKLVLAVHSATTVYLDPARDDALSSLGEVTGHLALTSMHEKMMADPTGQKILLDKPTIDSRSVDLDALLQSISADRNNLAPGLNNEAVLTFGQTYAKFMEKHGFHPEERKDVKYISDPELAFVMLRYRQCHDFWHALCDLPPSLLGELALKWIELIQTGLPVAALSSTVGTLRLNPKQRDILWNVYYPWAIKVGTEATFLMNVYYEKELDEDVNVLRERLGITPAPKPF